MRPYVRLSSILALTACLGGSSIGCGGGDGSNAGDPPVDTGVETEGDSTTGDTAVPDTGSPDTTVVDTGTDTASPDTTIEDTGTDTGIDSGEPDTLVADTTPEDTTPADTTPADTTPEDTTPADTTPVDTATCVIGDPCNDGNACTTGETYNSSCVCGGGTAVVCNDSNICTSDTCNTTTGCVYTATGEGSSCGPGKKCSSGICAELCVPGNTCSDSNACTINDKFDDTCACVGTTISCDDTNSCTNDSCNTSTGCVNTPVANGTPCGTSGSGNTCQAGVCAAPVAPPTISFTAPTEGFMKGFDAGSNACNGLTFTINFTAAAGVQAISWHLFTPTRTSPQMTGASCGAPTTALAPWHSGLGNPIYPFKIADSELVGKTSGTFSENIDVNGNYGGIAPWLFCTQPGTGGMAAATALDGTAIPAASTTPGSLRALANYCHSDNSTNDASRQWTLLVRIVDSTGASATAERKFIVHDI